MKKMFLAVLTAMIAFSFLACTKEKSVEEMLTQKKGWELTTATCSPAYKLWSGATTTNLFEGYISSCELDDVMIFDPNYAQILDLGKDLCTDQSGKQLALGVWKLIDDDHLDLYLPYYPGFLLHAYILKIDDEALKLQINFDEDDEVPATAYRGPKDSKTVRNYTFDLTYKVAK